MQVVKVELGDRSYQININSGAFEECASFLLQRGYSRKALLITDENVDKLYADDFMTALAPARFSIARVAVPAGEEVKSLVWADRLYTEAIRHGLDRKSPVIALGGGVVGDLAGFIAATYMRGVPFIQIPTTLLAQTDSSVGGKVAVNHHSGKNMIGAFYQPDAVFINTDTLKTLSDRDYASGLAEVVKYACLAGEDWLEFLAANKEALLDKETGVLEEMVARCCRYKADIVAEDEKEAGKRMWLNLGHTYGHAAEAAGGFSRYTHGEAVAIGLYGALLLSEEMGLSPLGLADKVCALLRIFSLPVRADGMSVEEIHRFLSSDKKASDGQLRWVLLQGAGVPLISFAVPESMVRRVLQKLIT